MRRQEQDAKESGQERHVFHADKDKSKITQVAMPRNTHIQKSHGAQAQETQDTVKWITQQRVQKCSGDIHIQEVMTEIELGV